MRYVKTSSSQIQEAAALCIQAVPIAEHWKRSFDSLAIYAEASFSLLPDIESLTRSYDMFSPSADWVRKYAKNILAAHKKQPKATQYLDQEHFLRLVSYASFWELSDSFLGFVIDSFGKIVKIEMKEKLNVFDLFLDTPNRWPSVLKWFHIVFNETSIKSIFNSSNIEMKSKASRILRVISLFFSDAYDAFFESLPKDISATFLVPVTGPGSISKNQSLADAALVVFVHYFQTSVGCFEFSVVQSMLDNLEKLDMSLFDSSNHPDLSEAVQNLLVFTLNFFSLS